MGQIPFYCHISDLDNIDKTIDLIEANWFMTVLGPGKEPEAWRFNLCCFRSIGGGHMKPLELNNCMNSQLFEF